MTSAKKPIFHQAHLFQGGAPHSPIRTMARPSPQLVAAAKLRCSKRYQEEDASGEKAYPDLGNPRCW